jgi:predicted DNA binding CopG/RHH family protein
MARNNEIRIKVSPEELERIKNKAKAVSMTLASYVRLVAIKSQVEIK